MTMLFKRNSQPLVTFLILGLNYSIYSSVMAQGLNLSPSQQYLIAQSDNQKALPDNLNPNANPLLFPTKPQEVEIENAQSITLEQAIELALKNNKDLQSTRLELEKAEAQLREALADQLPTVDGQLEFNQRADDTGGGPNRENFARDRTLLNGQLEVGYDLYTGGRRGAVIERARRQVYYNQLDIERISERIRFETTDAYYKLQNSDAQLAIAQAAVEDFSQTLRDAQLLEQAGLGTRFDVLQAQVDLANANQAVTRVIGEQRNARRELVRILGLGQQVELTAADEIKEAGDWKYSLEESIVMAYKNRAELQQILVQREINEKGKDVALAETKPQVSLFANYNFVDTWHDTLQATGYTDGYNLGARMRWRLFDGGKAIAREDQAQTDVNIDETNFANQRELIRLQVETAYNKMVANKENISTTEQAVVTATESLRLARLRFQAGVGTQTDVINAQRSLTESRGNFLQAIIGYNQSLNELQRAVSNLPDQNLFQVR
jgi:outer membrane protein TolC